LTPGKGKKKAGNGNNPAGEGGGGVCTKNRPKKGFGFYGETALKVKGCYTINATWGKRSSSGEKNSCIQQ